MSIVGLATLAFMFWFFAKLMERQERRATKPCILCNKPCRWDGQHFIHADTGLRWEPYTSEWWYEHAFNPLHKHEISVDEYLKYPVPHKATPAMEPY